MRILYYDIDTLRADHLGCYGYPRDTSPNIDRIAKQGVKFTNCYVSDAPCLPSRAALFTGRFGIHTGIVGHGGTAADMKPEGARRGFGVRRDRAGWIMALRDAGFYTASISPFAERHAAWWFYHGFNEMMNTGKCGSEIASEVVPLAVEWLARNGKRDNWLLHVNVWDPHTPYRTPAEFGNPFAEAPAPDWPTEEAIAEHCRSYGPHSARDVADYARGRAWAERWDLPAEIRTRQDFRRWIDGYDTGIRYADEHFGRLLDALARLGVMDDTMIIISSDHGENQGELNVYADHQTADLITSRVPMIVKPAGKAADRSDDGLHYQFDVMATVTELAGGEAREQWDAASFAADFREGRGGGRDHLVLSQQAWSCQRSVVFDSYILLRTYHDGLKDLPPYMLFDRLADPHETTNLAAQRPQVVEKGLGLLARWQEEALLTSDDGVDPMQIVMREGGPFHTRGRLEAYCAHLERTERGEHARALRERHGKGAAG